MSEEELKEKLREAFESGRASIFVDLDKIYDVDPNANVIWHEHEFEDFYNQNYRKWKTYLNTPNYYPQTSLK